MVPGLLDLTVLAKTCRDMHLSLTCTDRCGGISVTSTLPQGDLRLNKVRKQNF